MEVLIIALLVAAAVAIVAVQAVSQHRRLKARASEGRTSLPRTTWYVFGGAAVFFVFAVVVFPILLRR